MPLNWMSHGIKGQSCLQGGLDKVKTLLLFWALFSQVQFQIIKSTGYLGNTYSFQNAKIPTIKQLYVQDTAMYF